MMSNRKEARRWLWFTAPITALVALTSAVGLAVPNLYRGPATWALEGKAQDLMDILVLVVLVGAATAAARGSTRGWLVWVGTLTYLAYTFVIYAFSVFFNFMFLVYVAALGFSAWALIAALAATDWEAIRLRFEPRTPRFVGGAIVVEAMLFYVTWLKEDVPAILGGLVPASVAENAIPTNPVHVLDMALMLPFITFAGIWLWRQDALGAGMAGIVLTNMIFQTINVIGMMVYYSSAGALADPSPIGMLAILLLVNLGLLAVHLRGVNRHG